jgi:iron complex outermembrane receptor protein
MRATITHMPLAAIIAAALAAPAGAQTASEPAIAPLPAPAEPDTLPQITVTGTRIKGLDLGGALQGIQVDRQAILESGASELVEVLQDLPVTGGGRGTFSTATAGPLSGDTPVGATSVSLRGLGASATLTLINSRRASVSAFARGQESFIDASSIPTAAVERVEILPNGASALYGADAVAGVINYVLRRDFNGLELSASYGDSTAKSNEDKLNFSAVAGVSGDEHSLMVVFDYYRRNPFFLRDREASAVSFRPSQQGFYPSFNDLSLMVDDQTEEPQDGGCAAEDFGVGNLGEFCEVNTNAFVSASDRYESYSGMLTHRWAVNDSITLFNEFIYSRSDSRGTSSPANFSRAPVDPDNPFWPAALKEDLRIEGGCSSFNCFRRFPIFAWGKYPEPRAVEVSSTSFRLVSGFEAELGGTWSMESAFSVGGNDREQTGASGLVRSLPFYELNLGNQCTDGTKVRRWDINPARPTARYVGNTCEAVGKTTLWYNTFGGQTTQAPGVEEILETTARRTGKSRAYAFDVSASGDVFDFAGRTVKAALGAEFRREVLRDSPSGEAVATNSNPEPILGFSSTSASARRNQYSLFGEFYVPVTDTFDLQLAGRYDNYSGFGGDFNPKIAGQWRPTDWVALRGNWSTSFRAPSLAQSGAGVLLSSYRVRCSVTPEACSGNPNATGQALLSEDVGNPELGAENARSYSVGVVVEPTRTMDLRLDFWSIRHDDLVGIDRDDFIRRAIAGEFPVVAEGALPTGQPGLEARNIVRDPSGRIVSALVTDAHFQISNLGFQKTQGLDLGYTWYIPETRFGRFTFLFDATYIFKFDRQASQNAPLEELAGDFLYPRLYASGKLRWRSGPVRATFTGNYTGSYEDDPDNRTLQAVGIPPGTRVFVDNYFTADLSVSYDFSQKSYVQLVVRNLFDATPPRVLGSSANVDLYNHDLIGRFITGRIVHRF